VRHHAHQRVDSTNAKRTRGYNRAEHLHQHAKKPKRANQSAKLRYNLSGVSQRPTDLQRGPHLENAALGPPLSKPSQTLIHVQASKSAFSTGHFHPRRRPIPSALRAAQSCTGTCFSAHASTTAATISWVRRVSRSSTVTEPLSVRC
jgi:hypothetical protein